MSNYKHWEKYATKKQINIRDKIERQAKIENEPPSYMEFLMIKRGKVKKGWDL